MNNMMIFGYIYIYKRMRDYHAFILDKFSRIYSAEEILRIHKTTNEIRLFFYYICANLIMQSIYLVSKWYTDFENHSEESKRYSESIKIVLLTASIFMNYGISSSIKRAFNAQQKRNKNIKKIRYQQSGMLTTNSRYLSSENSINAKNLKSGYREESLLKSLSGETRDP
jgi:hypothetical protein